MPFEITRIRRLREVETKSTARYLVSTSLNRRIRVPSTGVFEFPQPAYSSSLNQRIRVRSTSVFEFPQPAYSGYLKWHIRLTEKL